MPDPKIAIILINFNNTEDTLLCLKSVARITYSNFFVIVVDNGSDNPPLAQIENQYPHVLCIDTHRNLGFAGGNNIGIKEALKRETDYIFLLNNDTIVDTNILHAFAQAAKENQKGGIFGSRVYRFHEPNVIDHQGGFWQPRLGEFTSNNHQSQNLDQMQQVDYVSGCSIFIKKEVIEKIGMLEEKFFLIWEETDFCYRAKKAGFEIWTVPKAKIWHKISASFSGGKPHMHYYWWRNRLFWIKRNLPKQEQRELYLSLLIKEIYKTTKRYYLQKLLFFMTRPFLSLEKKERKQRQILRNKAGFRGIIDYYFQRFGEGPSWLHIQKNKK